LATSASRRVMTQLYGDCRKKLQQFATPSKSLSARSRGGLRRSKRRFPLRLTGACQLTQVRTAKPGLARRQSRVDLVRCEVVIIQKIVQLLLPNGSTYTVCGTW
jgi:hypothetical protein